MNEQIIYESNLCWKDWVGMTSETKQAIIDDINSFSPTIPIETIASVVKFSVLTVAEGEIINVKLSVDGQKLCGKEPVKNFYSIIDNVVLGRLKDILFAMNLAYPGHIFIHQSILFRNREPATSLSYSTDISGRAYNDCKWLTFERLTTKQCWDWLTTKTNFLSYLSKTPIDRALHALSYESVANEDIFIFYVLLGIEALYNDGSNKEDSISAQLKRKLQAVIGTLPPSAIKEMSTMYTMRSKLVHGSTNIFKCWPSEECTEDEYIKADKERDYMITATGILIATIQRFIKADANTLVEKVAVSLESQSQSKD